MVRSFVFDSSSTFDASLCVEADLSGRIPIIIDNLQKPPFPVMETSAELLYLLKFADKDDVFGFKDELERSQCLQWLFFWHGSGAPYQGMVVVATLDVADFARKHQLFQKTGGKS